MLSLVKNIDFLTITRLVLCMCLWWTAIGEPTDFLGRDTKDSDKYLHEHLKTVSSEDECKLYLIKYGYFNCSVSHPIPRPNQGVDLPAYLQNFLPQEEVTESPGQPHLCDMTTEQYAEALREAQKFLKIGSSGTCDQDTKKAMSRPRCGNKDSVDDESAVPIKLSRSKISANESQNIAESWNRTRARRKRSTKRAAAKLYSLKESHMPSKSRKDMIEGHRRKIKARPPRPLPNWVDNTSSLWKLLRGKRDTAATRPNYRHIVRGPRSLASGFNKDEITWRLLNGGQRIEGDSIEAALKIAFRMWSEVTPLKFRMDEDSDAKEIDIGVQFVKRFHSHCVHPFDGQGGEIAHSWSYGNMHYDDEERWTNNEDSGLYLLKVIVHEIGHVLGLSHVARDYSVMYSVYLNHKHGLNFEIGWEDRKEIQKIYGVCRGKFNTVFDWVRKNVVGRLVYNTYFFRNKVYWMYENKNNRTRYGDPQSTTVQWKGVPDNVDAALSYRVFNQFHTFFFKGENVYKYDSVNDIVKSGFPTSISQYYGKMNDSSPTIPSNIDAVWTDFRDNTLHFIKDSKVYVYDLSKFGRGCCVRVSNFKDIYPPDPTDKSGKVLTGDIDSVFLSFFDGAVYFIKGDEMWQNVAWKPRPTRRPRHMLRYLGPWYHQYYDICDVDDD